MSNMTYVQRVMKFISAVLFLAPLCVAQQWTAPKQGWLYVLDAGGPGKGGNVFLVDPVDASIKGVIPTGYHPNFGICPDGLSLYVIDGPQSAGTLRIFDTRSGQLRATVNVPDRVGYTGRPAEPGVGCSPDGRWVFVQRMATVGPGSYAHSVSIVDTSSHRMLSQSVQLPGCGIADFVPWPFGNWDIAIRCSVANSLSLIRLADEASQPQVGHFSLALAPRNAVDGSFRADGQRVAVAVLADPVNKAVAIPRGGGGVDKLDPETLSAVRLVADDWQRWAPPGDFAIAPSAGLVYIGFVPYQERSTAAGLTGSISVKRTADWTEVANVRTSLPFSTLALSKDGKALYAVNTGAKSVTIFDTSTMSATKVLPGLGAQPALVLIQP